MEAETKSTKIDPQGDKVNDSKYLSIPDSSESELIPSGSLPGSSTGNSQESHHSETRRQKKVSKTVCYITPLIILFIGSIAAVGGAGYFNFQAFLDDREWNEILERDQVFANNIKGDSYFKGQILSNIPSLGKAVLTPELRQKLHRDQLLETVTLALDAVFLITAILHLILFVFFRKIRLKLKIMYLGYGIGGILLFSGMILLIISCLVFINLGYLDVRIRLEKSVAGTGNGVHMDFLNRYSDHRHKGSLSSSVKNNGDECFRVKETSLHAQYQAQLLLITKICAFRYAEMNHNDPCVNSHVDHIVFNNKTYKAKDLAAVHICPSDAYKLIACGLLLLGTLLCWLIMWLGSHAIHELLEPHFVKDRLVWTPRSVKGIAGWSPRGRESIPSYMQIEMSMRRRSTQAVEGVDMGILEEMSPPGLGSPSLVSLLHVENPLQQSLMTMAPNMIIRPPKAHLRLFRDHLAPEVLEKPSNISWFD